MAFFAVIAIGCATKHNIQTQSNQNDTLSSPIANAEPGSTYEVHIYVLAAGDTFAEVARKFQIFIMDLKTMNPDLNQSKLKVGQNVIVYEGLAR